MSVIILDIDGCISDDRWRQHHIDKSRAGWHKYHSLSAFDEVINRHLFENTRHQIVIFTGRPVHYHPQTVEWLKRAGLQTIAILMRPPDMFIPAAKLKEHHLGLLRRAHFESTGEDRLPKIERAYDDNESVISMYRRNGIKAKQVHYPGEDFAIGARNVR